MHYVGIDWADEGHQVAIVNASGKWVSEFAVPQTGRGFASLQKQLTALAPVVINIERPDGLLVDWLVQQGYGVYVTAPRAAASHRSRSGKDDRSDARLLANLLRVGSEDCRPLVRHSPLVQQLVQELRALEQMQRQQVRLTNQLRQVLLQYYPTMLHLFSSLNTKIALRFLQVCPNPQTAAGLSRLELAAVLKQQGYTRMSQFDRLYQKLQVAMPTTEVWQGYGQHVLALVPLLQTLQVQLAQLRQQVQHTFATHPEAAWWQALPGAGDLTVCRLLALMGDNRQAFASGEALQALAGTVPVTRRSGKSLSVRFRWGCTKALRRAVMDFARNSLAKSGWANSYYQSQLERGHAEQRALRALANRWVRIIWTLWQRRQPYDEARHVANRSRNGRTAA
jgi:transposase